MTGYRRSLFVRFINRHVSAIEWLYSEFIPSCIPLIAVGVMIIATLICIGETPSGPAADLSSSTIACSNTTPYLNANPGPEPCTQASRAAQDLCGVMR